MISIATFPNIGEAGFVQSLLASEGIEASLSGPSITLDGVQEVRLEVSEMDVARATEVVAKYQSEKKEERNAQPDAHPSSGFPFLGVMGFVALLWSFMVGVWSFFIFPNDSPGIAGRILNSLGVGVVSLLHGLLIGFLVALVALVVRVVWRKINAA